MPIEFPCSRCGRQLRAGEEYVGREAKCPECGALSVIPAPTTGNAGQSLPNQTAANINPFASPDFGGRDAQQSFMAASPGEIVPTRVGYGEPLSMAWEILKARFFKCAGFALVMLGLGVIYTLVMGSLNVYVAGVGQGRVNVWLLYLFQFLSLLPLTWIYLGVIQFFQAMARGQNPSLGLVFAGMPHLLSGLAVSVLLMVITILFTLPLAVVDGPIAAMVGIVGAIARIVIYLMLFQALPLIVDKGLGVSESLSLSMTVMRGNKIVLFAVLLTLAVLILLSFIPVGLGLFITIPYWCLVNQVFYLRATGQAVSTPGQQVEA